MLGTIVGLILTFLLGSKVGKLKTVTKQAEKMEEENNNLENKVEIAQSEKRTEATKAESAEKKAELAAGVVKLVSEAASKVPPVDELDKLEESVKEATVFTSDDALEVARKQAELAEKFRKEHSR